MSNTRLDWPVFSHDHARTGRTDAVGHITRPGIAWQKDFSARDTFLEAAGSSGSRTYEVLRNDKTPPVTDRLRCCWGLSPPPLDIAGDGRLVDALPTSPWDTRGGGLNGYNPDFYARWGKFLADIPGLQRLGWTTVKTDRAFTEGEKCYLQMHSFEHGLHEPHLIWQAPTAPNNERPVLIVEDIDGDGRLEAVYSRWRGVVANDALTGEEKYGLMDYRGGHKRPYGFFGSWRSPSGKVYLVVAGVFCGHVGVLSVENSKLVNLWTHLFDEQSRAGIVRRFSIDCVGPDPVADFTGAGRGEILMSVFNDTEDERWHLLGYDVETGKHVVDIPDVYLHGHADVDGDGQEELLCQVCPGRVVAREGELQIYKIFGAKPQLIWSHPQARWSMGVPQQLPLNRYFTPFHDLKEPVCGTEGPYKNVIFLSAPEDENRESEVLKAMRIGNDGKPLVVWEIRSAPDARLSALSVKKDKVFVCLRHRREQDVQLECRNVRIKPLAASAFVPYAPQPIIVGPRQENGSPRVVVSSSAVERIYCLKPGPDSKSSPTVKWMTPGRGMTAGHVGRPCFGVVAGDIDRDGRDEVLFVREARDGHSQLVAFSAQGQQKWVYDFPQFGAYSGFSEGITTFWGVGNFLDPNRLDIMVSNRRSIMHSDETLILNSEALEVEWHRDILHLTPPYHVREELKDRPRGCGGWLTAQGDFDDDGLDNIVIPWPSEYWVLNGKTGDQLADEILGPVPLEGIGNLYLIGMYPLVADIDGDGSLETIVCHEDMVLALGHHSGHAGILWHTDRGDGAKGWPAIGDVNRDGNLELGLPGCRDGFRCLDAASGKVRWRVPLQSKDHSASNCVCADINGDGQKEFIYGSGPVLVAAAEPGNGSNPVIWKVGLGADIGVIAVGDVNGDGASEILAGCHDGSLYCIA